MSDETPSAQTYAALFQASKSGFRVPRFVRRRPSIVSWCSSIWGIGNSVSVRFGERTVKLRAGESAWKAKLGGTQRLYFLFAYHYALLNLTRFENTLYPGFAMIDFPASLEDRAAIADK